MYKIMVLNIHPTPSLSSKFDPSCQQGCIVLNNTVLCGGCERLAITCKVFVQCIL